jgi:Domain of unknown function (DUF4290)
MTPDYNSARPQLIIPEYGRNIHKMINFAVSVPDKQERNKVAQSIINVMGQLFPYLRDVDDFKHKLWDHLFIMSEFKLDVDSPYPIPSIETFQERPKMIKYPDGNIRYGHYGKIIQDLIAKARKVEDPEKKKIMAGIIAGMMKRAYIIWNRDSVRDEVIIMQLEEMSKGELIVKEIENFQQDPYKPNNTVNRNNKKRINPKSNSNNNNNQPKKKRY